MRGQKSTLPRDKWDKLEYYLANDGDIPADCAEYVELFVTAEAILRELGREPGIPIRSDSLATLIGSDAEAVEYLLFGIFLVRCWVNEREGSWSLEARGRELAAVIMQADQDKTAIISPSTRPRNQPPLAFPS